MNYDIRDLLSLPMMARRLKLSESTLRRWMVSGKLKPAFIDKRTGRQSYYYTEEQEKLVKRQMKQGIF